MLLPFKHSTWSSLVILCNMCWLRDRVYLFTECLLPVVQHETIPDGIRTVEPFSLEASASPASSEITLVSQIFASCTFEFGKSIPSKNLLTATGLSPSVYDFWL